MFDDLKLSCYGVEVRITDNTGGELCRRLHADPRRCVLIGDNLESDVRGARSVGMNAIVTLSGITTRAMLQTAAPELQPDAVVADLRELL